MAMSTFRVGEFPIDKIPYSCSWVIIGAPKSGKSNFVKYLVYIHRSRYPVCKIQSGTEDSNRAYQKNFPQLFITDKYVESQQKNYVMRQKRCKSNGCKNGRAVVIIDDCSEDTRLYKTPIFQALYKNGTQHWNGMIITALQYCIDFPPSVRKCASYVAIAFESDLNERQKLYRNFGGLCGTFEDFCTIMDAMIVTQDENGRKKDHQDPTDRYTFLVIKRSDPSPDREKNVFYCKALKMKNVKWRFGCPESWKWDKARRDPLKVSSYEV